MSNLDLLTKPLRHPGGRTIIVWLVSLLLNSFWHHLYTIAGIARFLPCAASTVVVDTGESSDAATAQPESPNTEAEGGDSGSGSSNDSNDDVFGGKPVIVQPSPTTFDCCTGTACQPDPSNTFTPRCMPLDSSLTNPRSNTVRLCTGPCVDPGAESHGPVVHFTLAGLIIITFFFYFTQLQRHIYGIYY